MTGFPPELRPLLGLVIVLSIAHVLLRARSRAAARRRELRSRADAARAELRRSAASAQANGPIEPDLPAEPADALAELRARATGRGTPNA